jgi:hypothetical protein
MLIVMIFSNFRIISMKLCAIISLVWRYFYKMLKTLKMARAAKIGQAAGRVPGPNEQGERTQTETCSRPNANGPKRTRFGPKMRRAVGDALRSLVSIHSSIMSDNRNFSWIGDMISIST